MATIVGPKKRVTNNKIIKILEGRKDIFVLAYEPESILRINPLGLFKQE